MGSVFEPRGGIACAMEGGVFSARRPGGAFPDTVFRACGSAPVLAWASDVLRWEWGDFRQPDPAERGTLPGCGLLFAAAEEFVLVTGCLSQAETRALTDPAAARRLLRETERFWREKTEVLRVETPEPRLDRWLNGWGVYQTAACRLFARTSLYQSGGAVGFRDQLQDAAALCPWYPALLRGQLLACAAHQYARGDVMHWWHAYPSGDRGVRTRCADDLLWLPWAVSRYVSVTGDRTILLETAPFLASPELKEGERDRYEEAIPSGSGTILEHALLACKTFLSRGTGPHGLPRILAGDWNDGMDRLGIRGRGESVWLGWFGAMVLGDFAPLCAPADRDRLLAAAAERKAACETAWAGDRYLRAWDDDGGPLGEPGAAECALDSLSQSFAALAGADPDRADRALTTALNALYDKDHHLVRLLAPPFDGRRDPGYISAYLPGFRENGGQYTHAALWLVLALLRRDRRAEAWTLLRDLLPTDRGPEYGGEPCAVAADVTAAPGYEGRAGWTWYTGSAGWLLRLCTEELLGLRVRGGHLTVRPRLPGTWAGFRARLVLPGKTVFVEARGGEYTVEEEENSQTGNFFPGE